MSTLIIFIILTIINVIFSTIKSDLLDTIYTTDSIFTKPDDELAQKKIVIVHSFRK